MTASAQETVVIGGGPAVVGGGGSGIVVNNEVLDSLGSAPQVPVPPAGAGTSLSGGLPYRQPDTGQLLVTRPGTLLFPPESFPRSRLTVEPSERTQAQAGATEPELTSRLLVPRAPETAPRKPMPPAAAPAPEVQPAPMRKAPPAEAEPAPEMAETAGETQGVPSPQATTGGTAPGAASAAPAEAPPAPSALTRELATKPESEPEPASEAAPAMAQTSAEIESPPQVQPAPPAPPQPPAGAPASAAAAQPEPPPPPTETLSEKPASDTQTAAIPPAAKRLEQVRVLFRDGSAELGDEAMAQLSEVAAALAANPGLRVQLLAYAKGSEDGSSRARRLSLSRALAVRAYLIQKDVRSTRMDVRALGDKTTEDPMDRVDILPQTSNQ